MLLKPISFLKAAGGGSSFDPAVDLFGSSEVGFWLEANTSDLFTDDGVTNVTTAGDSIAQWNDRSPNGLVFRDFPTAPTYQTTGAPHVDFVTGGFESTTAIDPSNSGITLIAAFRPDETNTDRFLINGDGLITSANTARLFQFKTRTVGDVEVIGFDSSGGTFTANAAGVFSAGALTVAIATLDNTSAEVYINDSTSDATATNSDGGLQAGSNIIGLGAATDATPGAYFDGGMYAVGLVDRVLSSAEIDNVVTYCNGLMP